MEAGWKPGRTTGRAGRVTVTGPSAGDSMRVVADKELTLRMDSEEYRALRLHAVRQGTSVEALLLTLARQDVAHAAAAAAGGQVDPARTREQTAAAILRRAGVDPDSPEHRAIAERAAATVRRRSPSTRPGGRRGAA